MEEMIAIEDVLAMDLSDAQKQLAIAAAAQNSNYLKSIHFRGRLLVKVYLKERWGQDAAFCTLNTMKASWCTDEAQRWLLGNKYVEDYENVADYCGHW